MVNDVFWISIDVKLSHKGHSLVIRPSNPILTRNSLTLSLRNLTTLFFFEAASVREHLLWRPETRASEKGPYSRFNSRCQARQESARDRVSLVPSPSPSPRSTLPIAPFLSSCGSLKLVHLLSNRFNCLSTNASCTPGEFGSQLHATFSAKRPFTDLVYLCPESLLQGALACSQRS
jgi:hypothetical protein